MKDYVGAVSVGIVGGEKILDLSYEEDSRASVDMNVVMTGSGRLIEIQGTAEKEPFTPKELANLVKLAKNGIDNILTKEKKILPLKV